MRIGTPRGQRHPRSLHLGRIRRCRSSRRDVARLAVPIRLPRPRFDDSGSNAVTGGRLLLRGGSSRTGSRRTPARFATSTRSTAMICRRPQTHRLRSGRHPTPPSSHQLEAKPMTSPLDYNQHLLAYIQAWRQLLDASAAMTSGLSFPPGISAMPMPPVPPMPPMTPLGSGGLGGEPADRLHTAAVRLPSDVAAVPRAGDRFGSRHNRPSDGFPIDGFPVGGVTVHRVAVHGFYQFAVVRLAIQWRHGLAVVA